MVGGRSQSQLSVPLCGRPAWEWVQTLFLEWGWGAGLGRWVSGGLRQGWWEATWTKLSPCFSEGVSLTFVCQDLLDQLRLSVTST